ncbi:lipopolysaccharide biosynthesis protein [Lentisphaera araneosa HTCC2155]|uniref:Lipopolysaccharide biosynthesis protein n=1 Tax=Lentisphaera araneosa HTCC2155 TaxID=313628 RepID=A6DQH0_9BACT|nr:glycosyltransferase family 4 protein [Lentisphaera araneosa]EDM26051.1 lipopolysaccharide biosynthesis protein [Lentisphaera araneosa HTCC2155]
MKICIHDYGKYPFIQELAQKLANDCIKVDYLYNASFLSPNSNSIDEKKQNFQTIGISTKDKIDKYNFKKRFVQEVEYSKNFETYLNESKPDIVITANCPLFTVDQAYKWAQKNSKQFHFWVQDVWSVAVKETLNKKFGILGNLAAQYFIYLEKKLLKKSHSNIVISKDFINLLNEWKITNTTHVLENWAPLKEIDPQNKENTWSQKHQLDKSFNYIYTGTLGLKHNPQLLIDLAQSQIDSKVVVVSQGSGADYLKDKKDELNISNLKLLPFQDKNDYSKILASSDVLVAVLEKEAGNFSVPSKILSYHCAQKPILASVPKTNLSYKILTNNKSGLGVDCENNKEFLSQAKCLKGDEKLRNSLAENARKYAELTFDIDLKVKKFIKILGINI